MSFVHKLKNLPHSVTFENMENFKYDSIEYSFRWVYKDVKFGYHYNVSNQMMASAKDPDSLMQQIVEELVANILASSAACDWSDEAKHWFIKQVKSCLANGGTKILDDGFVKAGAFIGKTATIDVDVESKMLASAEASTLSRQLPGVNNYVSYPCNCFKDNRQATVWNIVQHLNDDDTWSREAIADWIDELHDKKIINAEFEPWEEDPLAEEEKQLEAEKLYEEASAVDEWVEGVTPVAVYIDEVDGWKQVGYTTDVGIINKEETDDNED